jgi:hypothetical protein
MQLARRLHGTWMLCVKRRHFGAGLNYRLNGRKSSAGSSLRGARSTNPEIS